MERIILPFLRAIAFMFVLQPRRLQLMWGGVLGALFYGLRYRYSVVNQNIQRVFPDLARQSQAKIARESYRHLGNLTLEILMLLGPLRNFVLKYVDVQGFENFLEAQKLGKGVIFLSSHVGNWEIMAATGGVIHATDLMLVTKRLKPEWLHRAIEEGRRRCHVEATYEPRTLRDVLAHLKKKGTVGFVMDQYVGPPVGVRVPLFGVPVGAAMVVAALTKRTGAPILPVENYRTPEGRWVVEVKPPVSWQAHSNPHYELALNTALYTNIIEKSILAHPSQWLWAHRRFKGDLSPLRESEWSEPRARK